MKRKAFAPGKLILSGEYAVVFGYPGIAIPTTLGVEATFEHEKGYPSIEVKCEEPVLEYAMRIVRRLEDDAEGGGTLTLRSNLPFGKGMGSSTAYVVAITQALFGKRSREKAETLEKEVNPYASGIDFETIWKNTPLLFKKGTPPKKIALPDALLRGAFLIDTSLPNQSTSEMVAWAREQEKEIEEPLRRIARCTERLLSGEELKSVIRDHHKAQVALGVVPPVVRALVAEIESSGGAAKVVGAGARTGGAGMVLALGDEKEVRRIATAANMPIVRL